jgi:hypothetical protein
MTNHYHCVVETPDANLSKGMRQLNGVYTQTSNRRHGLVGHLFQGRFKAILVERDAYLLELARYVVLNPVRAAMVPEAGDWPWSSYRAMVGQETAPARMETDWVLGQFARERSAAQAGYAAFVRQGIEQPSVWQALRHQVFLGSEAFAQRHCAPSKPAERPRSSTRPAPLARQAPRGLCPGLPRSARGHGTRLPNRGLLDAGDRRLFRRTLLYRESCRATHGDRPRLSDGLACQTEKCLIARPDPGDG